MLVGLLFFVERRTLETRTNRRTNKELGRRTLGNEPGLGITRTPDSWKRTRTWIMNRGGELDAGLLEGGLTLDESRTKLRTGLLSEGTPDELYESDFSER
ncbi:unnamed protein product [Rhizophagus irregularis]|nr:unnamed protein product [Rhizophagus irregularis]